MNNFTLITGCTSGIGYSLAQQFAKNGHSLILVSRNIDKLKLLQQELNEKYQIKIFIIQQDLSYANSALEVYEKVKKLNVDIEIICNNAGMGLYGEFNEYEIEKYEQMIQLNIISLMELTYYFLNDMKLNNRGKILNIASTGGFVCGPYMAVYYATKSFVISFSEAISMELKNTNIRVICVCPGTTNTDFFSKATNENINLIKNMNAMSSEEVAKYAYKKMMQDNVIVIPGLRNKLAVFGNRFISRKFSRKIIYNIQCKRGKIK